MGNAHFKENENGEIRQLACKVEGMGYTVNYSKPKNKWITITKVNGVSCSDKNKEEIKDFLQGILNGDDWQPITLPQTKTMRAYARGDKEEQERTYVKDDILDDISEKDMMQEIVFNKFDINKIRCSYLFAISRNIYDDMEGSFPPDEEGLRRIMRNAIPLIKIHPQANAGDYVETYKFEKLKRLMKRFEDYMAKMNGEW